MQKKGAKRKSVVFNRGGEQIENFILEFIHFELLQRLQFVQKTAESFDTSFLIVCVCVCVYVCLCVCA